MMFGFKTEKPVRTPGPTTLTLGYLGKLPERADYIHCACDSREVQSIDASLKQWLSLQVAEGPADTPGGHYGVGFLQVGGHDRQGISGYVFPSEDSHGRLYPFFYFSRWSDTDLYFKPAPLMFGTLQRFNSIESGLGWPRQRPGLETCDRIRAIPSPCAGPAGRSLMKASLSQLADVSLHRWLNYMVGGDPRLQKRFLAGCKALIARYQNRRHRPPEDLELPLGPDDMASVSLLFWLHVLTPAGPDNPWRPDILWSLNPAGGRLRVLARPLAGSHWQQSLKPAAESGWTATEPEHDLWAEQLIAQQQLCLLDVVIHWSHLE